MALATRSHDPLHKQCSLGPFNPKPNVVLLGFRESIKTLNFKTPK